MTISVKRNQQACCTCIFWGGKRRLATEQFDEVHTNEKETGLCNGPGTINRYETNALNNCPLWREL